MEQVPEENEIYQMPIKKKPKIQEVNNTNLHLKQQQCFKESIDKSNLKKIDRKIQVSLLESLKLTEKIQLNVKESSLKIDFNEWEPQHFIFKLKEQTKNSNIQQDDQNFQYFNDFNQKCNIYPYQHFVDLKPETDHIIMKQPLCESKYINKQNQVQNQIKVIALKQNEILKDIQE